LIFKNNQANSLDYFNNAWFGLSYQIKDVTPTPALLIFSEVAVYKKPITSKTYFKSHILSFTTYKTFDPIVFSLTPTYRINQKHQDNKQVYKPGNSLLINPQIGFAVNDKVTLTCGMQWVNRLSDKTNNIKSNYRLTKTALILGAGFGLS